MKKFRFLAIALAVILLLSALPLSATATETEIPDAVEVRKVNIAFVIDGSGSLINGHKADIEGNRYVAVNYFLDVMAESGNNSVSAIVFNANTSSNTDKESMLSGLALNTGLVTISTEADKESLKQQIQDAHVGGYTDIGTALLTAAETLEKQSAENGLESAIILFTDGSTELPTNAAYQQSIANRDAAVKLVKEKGIDLFGLFLNHKNTSSSTEVFDLVREAHGYPSTATEEDLDERYFEVTSSDSLQDAFETFRKYIFTDSSDKDFPVNEDVTFLVPGIGVDDVNISVMASSSVLSQISVTLTRPNGTTYTSEELNNILSRGKTYALYKVKNPEAGLWTVRVNAPEGELSVNCKLIMNLSIAAHLTAPDSVPGKVPFDVSGSLSYKGQMVTDPASYQEYECALRVVNAAGQETLYPMTLADSGVFTTQVTLPEFTAYYANVVFTCGDSIRISSDSVAWAPINTNPAAPETYTVKSSVGLFGGKKNGTVDLTELVEDAEDADSLLTYSLDKGEYPAEAVTLEGTVLTVDGEAGGKGTMQVTFTDTDGGQAVTTLAVKFSNTVVLEIVLLVLGLLAVLAAVAVFLYIRNKKLFLEGQVTITLPTYYRETEHEIVLTLDAGLISNKTLLQVLNDNRDEFRRAVASKTALRSVADQVASTFMKVNEIELGRVRFAAVMGAKEGKSDTAPVYPKVIRAAAPSKSKTTGNARKAATDILSGGKSATFPLSEGPSGRIRYLKPQEANTDNFVW